ncbi:uncharacterized protein CTRU02_201454 [Colletotrichum truncatum]|uniref:Uncharacterized protein n=1 Tax=Colletotrichum truncatum TaxID=5467 RepID=A0ACC3ZI19_COLTU|nr:uncharacterized protein CTRU02_14325 [Colletotrichum truncatum]KAF6782286.1 hypothetical protein CTRU02_14325 [Colletotrichum truncatum]
MSKQTVFVCGATGTVGGAVAKNLLSGGIAVHALVRNPETPAAKALSAMGALLTPGDYENEDVLQKAMVGVTGVCLNLSPNFADQTWESRTAKRIMSTFQQSPTPLKTLASYWIGSLYHNTCVQP